MHDVGDGGHGLLTIVTQPAVNTAENNDRHTGDRQKQHRHGGKLPVLVKDDAKQGDYLETIFKDDHQGVRHCALQQGDIRDYSGDQLAGRGLVEKGDRQGVDMTVDPVSQVSDYGLADFLK